MGSAPSKEEAHCPEWDELENSVTAASQCQSINGFEFTSVTSLKNSSKMMHIVSLRNRLYPLQYMAISHEPEIPGYYNFVVMGSLSDMPYKINAATNGQVGAQMTVPIIKNTNMTIASSIGQGFNVLTSIINATPKYNIKLDVNCLNYFSNSNLDLGFVHNGSIGKCGLHVQVPLRKETPSFSLGITREVNKIQYGFLGDYKDTFVAILGVQYKHSEKTIVGASMYLIPSTLSSSFQFGAQRGFMRSIVSASVSTTGTVTTLFQRNVSDKMSLLISGNFNQATRSYGIGLGVQLMTD